jgi:CRP-like cAMP-binding protein
MAVIPRGRALFWQEERHLDKIEILQGVVRAVRLLENGNRQILAFYWPGDIVRPSHSACQQFTAEAVTTCRVLRSPVSNPCNEAEPCGVQRALTDTLSLVTTMGQKNIIQRIAWFLMRIRRHLPEDPTRPQALQILVPRADIADHLGTSIETVSRTLADFRDKGLIDLPNRKTIRFIDLAGLAQMAGD